MGSAGGGGCVARTVAPRSWLSDAPARLRLPSGRPPLVRLVWASARVVAPPAHPFRRHSVAPLPRRALRCRPAAARDSPSPSRDPSERSSRAAPPHIAPGARPVPLIVSPPATSELETLARRDVATMRRPCDRVSVAIPCRPRSQVHHDLALV